MQLLAMIVAASVAWLAFLLFLGSSQKWRPPPVNLLFNRLVFPVVAAFVVGIWFEPAPSPASAAAVGKIAPSAPKVEQTAKPEPPQERAAAKSRTLVRVAAVAPEAADACSAFTGLKREQCGSCKESSGPFRFICDERARWRFCESRWGTDPDCPEPQSLPDR